MNHRWLVTALGAALAACGSPTNTPLSQLNLNRPVDIAFACYGGMRITNGGTTADPAAEVTTTAQPTASCEQRSLLAPRVPPGQEDIPGGATIPAPNWYGFILQSAAGTLAVASWATKPSSQFAGNDVLVLDADPLTPGKNAISVGEEPIAIATDKAGCYEVTANAGSCDLSELSINSAIEYITPVPGRMSSRVQVDRRTVTTKAGAILARPSAMVAEPNTAVIGNSCPATATGLLYIAYPACHVVAGVDASTGAVVTAIQYDATGKATLLSSAGVDALTCPAECSDVMGAAGGGATTLGARPVTLALELDPRVNTKRLAIGADNSSLVTMVELDPITSLPTSLSQIALQNTTGKLGVTQIALSPQIGMGGLVGETDDTGTAGGQGQYVYAVATDNTVRVADVLNLNKECDTQVDTRFVRNILDVKALQCFPVGDPATPQRRSGAKGPGIELVGDAVPTSVAFVKASGLPLSPTDTSDSRPPGPLTLLGYFAIVTASNGQTFVVNVDDDNNSDSDFFDQTEPQLTAPTLIIAHQLRDSITGRDAVDEVAGAGSGSGSVPSCLGLGTATLGGPHTTTAPTQITIGGPIAASKVTELPTLRQISCFADADAKTGVPVSELQFAADPASRDRVFPDLRNLFSDESWTLTWEAPLSQDSDRTAIDGPSVRAAQMVVDSAARSRIVDSTHPFCAMGVEPFDILQMRGCNQMNGDSDCPSGYECYVHPDSTVVINNAAIGTCMLRDEATRLANACRDFFISDRRYTIASATNGELVLLPRKHELRTTPLDGCTGDAQCKALADYVAQTAQDGVSASTPVNDDKWSCRIDDARKPINGDPTKKRCIQTCSFHSNDKANPNFDGLDRDKDCDPGTICQGATPGTTSDHFGTCMEGVMPPQACVNGPQQFDVRASEAFTVIGSQSGYVHPIVDVGGTCKPDPALGPSSQQLQIGRLPLTAPACGDPATTDPITGALAGGGFEPNPCSLTVPQSEYQSTCNGSATVSTTTLEQRTAPAIKLRTRGLTLTMVDPYYPGDKTCALDRQGFQDPSVVSGVDRVPVVYPGYELTFRQTSGYTPLTISGINPAFPVKVVRGPSDSIWVIDDGDFLSTTGFDPSTAGKVFRIESINLGAVNLLE